MKTLASILMMALWVFNLQAQTALEIVKKADEKMRGESAKTEMEIKIVRPTWERTMNMVSWSKGTELSMVLLTAPAKDKGTVFLKRYKEIYNWLPSIERSIKMPPSMMMQSWMGTDLTNDDLVKESSILEDYNHSIVSTETIDGRECWKIKLVPKPNAPVVWGMIYSWIDKKDFIQMKTEFYDEDEYLVNTMVAGDIKTMGGKVIATRVEVIPADKPGQKTVMTTKSIQFDIPIEESFFSTQNMKKVK